MAAEVVVVVDSCDSMPSGLDMAVGSCSDHSPEWAFLPRDIVISILEKLVSEVSDYIHFATVCKNWLSAAREHQALLTHDQRSSVVFFPELLIPTHDKSDLHRGFYNAIEDRTVNTRFHIPYNKRCCGSSHGWLIFPEETMALTLFNPFTGATIHLPPAFSPPTEEEIIRGFAFYDHQYQIQKVVLSADPIEAPDNYEALAVIEHCNLAFFRCGSSKWIYVIPGPGEPPYEEVTYFNGKFYAASLGILVRLDVVCGSKFPGKSVSINVRKLARREFNGLAHKTYLTGTSYGHLLWIDRYYAFQRVGIVRDDHNKIIDYFEISGLGDDIDDINHSTLYITSHFKVYKVEEEIEGETNLTELKTLEDDVLFLGHNDSILVSTRNFSKYTGNCIYYMGDCIHIPYDGNRYPFGAIDTGVFDIEGQCCKQLEKAVKSRRKGHMPPPIWIIPKANLLVEPTSCSQSTNILNLECS